jgi:hypothetical protein
MLYGAKSYHHHEAHGILIPFRSNFCTFQWNGRDAVLVLDVQRQAMFLLISCTLYLLKLKDECFATEIFICTYEEYGLELSSCRRHCKYGFSGEKNKEGILNWVQNSSEHFVAPGMVML